MTTQFNVLMLGNSDASESKPICWFVDAFGASLRRSLRIVDIAKSVDDDWLPDLVIVLQHWSDEFPQADVNLLLAQFPLARWVCCYGTWCESDGRNRPDAWPVAIRVPMRRGCLRIQQELRVLIGEESPLTLTAGRDEVFSFDFDNVSTEKLASRTVLVSSPDSAFRSMIEAAVRNAGASVVVDSISDSTTDSHSQPDVIVFDADPWTHRRDLLTQIRRNHPESQMIALMTMAHPDSFQPLKHAGCDAVLPKFSSLESLIAKMAFEESAASV